MASDAKGFNLKNLNLSFLRAKELVGVDIGSSTIKFLFLKGSPGKYSVQKWGIETIGSNGSQEVSTESRKEEVIKTLKQIVKEHALANKKVATSISGNSVIVRYVKFPKLSPQDLKLSIQFEAEPYIPFDIRDVNISFHILNDVIDEGQKKMETVLVAAKSDFIYSKINILKSVGLKPSVVDVDSFALESAYECIHDSNLPETVLIVNIGASVTNMTIIENGISRVVRDVFISGNSITKVLQKNLQCSFQEAEDLKKKYGILVTVEDKDRALSEDNKESIQISNIMFPVLKDIISEVQRSLDFYLSQGSDKTINRILLCGGTSKLKNISNFFSQELKMPVEALNPFLRIRGADKIPSDIASSFVIALGLATRKSGDSII
ncbi:MAG: type IV pilus assembly protein PilM [bacterium]